MAFLLLLLVSFHTLPSGHAAGSFWESSGVIRPDQIPKPAELVLVPREFTRNGFQIALEEQALRAFLRMAKAAGRKNIRLTLASGFRSNAAQSRAIEARRKKGQLDERIFSNLAPVGYSSHLTGRAIDFAPNGPDFSKTEAYLWLSAHAEEFGFHEALARGAAPGVSWEPWHFKYQGSRR